MKISKIENDNSVIENNKYEIIDLFHKIIINDNKTFHCIINGNNKLFISDYGNENGKSEFVLGIVIDGVTFYYMNRRYFKNGFILDNDNKLFIKHSKNILDLALKSLDNNKFKDFIIEKEFMKMFHETDKFSKFIILIKVLLGKY